MKVLDGEKVIALLEMVKERLPGDSGILPKKYFSKRSMDYLIQGLWDKSVDLDILTSMFGAMDKRSSDLLLVGFDHAGDDNAVLIIGRKDSDDKMQVINEFHGKEAEELYKKLIGEGKEVQVIKSAHIHEVSFMAGPDGTPRLELGLTNVEYQEPTTVIFSPEEIFEMWKKEYLDERDPVINYSPHKSIPNSIKIELHSGFEWIVQVSEGKLLVLWKGDEK